MPRILLFLLLCSTAKAATIERIWLTFQREEPTHVTVNWETAQPAPSAVIIGTNIETPITPPLPLGKLDVDAVYHFSEELVTLHHLEVPIPKKDVTYDYQVISGEETSVVHHFKAMPSKELRIAVVGDWGFSQPDLAALIKDDVHVLMTAGDNVGSLHQKGREGTKAFSALIDSQPELFRGTPFMPVLGNHDREMRPRGPKPPPEPVYDVEAAAYREFFALPGNEWNYVLAFPDFSARFIALDLEHISDMGTTWQTGHPFAMDSPQLAWYRQQMEPPRPGHTITIQNERNATMRSQLQGEWGRLFQQGTAVITGFGYFAERAVVDGFPYYNTALKGDGARYPDPKSAFFASEHSYILLTFKPNSPMQVEIKSLTGKVLDQQNFPAR